MALIIRYNDSPEELAKEILFEAIARKGSFNMDDFNKANDVLNNATTSR